ncbi:MAG: hypothetical protein IJP92_08325 [Lachnospiraceae bacterium]|nr:hypothetical protein [Lachnospiraceae bacterium]
MKKVVYGVGSALLMVVLGLAVFMLFLVVPEREMVVDTVAIAAASATTQAGEETEPFVPESHARRNDDTSEEDTSPAEASSAASSFVSSSASAERTADNTGAGTGTGRAERDDAGTGATAAQTGRGATDSGVTALSEDGGTSATAAGAEENTTADRPNAGNATRERTTRQQETQEETQQEPQEREERRTAVVENPTPAPQPAGQTTQLNTGNYNSYLSVSVTDLGNGNYEAQTAPVGGGSFFNAAVTVTVRLTIDVISDVRTVNGIEGNPTGDGRYTHTLTEETRVSLYPDDTGYASTGSYWSVDRNDRLTITGLRVSLAGVNSVSGSVTR